MTGALGDERFEAYAASEPSRGRERFEEFASAKPLLVRRLLRSGLSPSLRYGCRQRAMELPLLAAAVVAADRSFSAQYRLVAGTQLVVDGFPRSANSFTTIALDFSNPDLSVASHMHSARLLIWAARRDLPALALVRSPRDAVASAARLAPAVNVAPLANAWTRYYGVVSKLLDRVEVASFAEVTTDLGAVMERLNLRYGLSLVPYASSATNDARIRAENDRRGGVMLAALPLGAHRVGDARPDPATIVSRHDRRAERALETADRMHRDLWAAHAAWRQRS